MNWAFGLLLFVLGLGLGYLLRSRLHNKEGDVQTLSSELEQVRFDLSQRQQEIADHFQRSRELMMQMNECWEKTNNYLNESAHNLLDKKSVPAQEDKDKSADLEQAPESHNSDEQNPKEVAPKDYAKGSSGMLTDKERVAAD